MRLPRKLALTHTNLKLFLFMKCQKLKYDPIPASILKKRLDKHVSMLYISNIMLGNYHIWREK